MPGPTFVREDDVSLRTVEREDVQFLQENRMAPSIRRAMSIPRVENREQAVAFFESEIVDGDADTLLVCREATGTDAPPEPVGLVTLFDVDEVAGTAEVAFWTEPDSQDNGYATAGVELLLPYAFGERRLHKVAARVRADNEGAARVLEKVGFEAEGLLREEAFGRGQHHDVRYFGLLGAEWAGEE